MSDTSYSLASAPDEPLAKAPKKRSLLKFSLLATALLFGYLFYQCGTGLYRGSKQGEASVRHFHSLLNASQYEEIYNESSEEFQQAGSKDELLAFFKAVHEKLGDARDSHLRNINVNATPMGTTTTGIYETTFQQGPATETFVWRKSGDNLSLVSYNIQSRQLILK